MRSALLRGRNHLELGAVGLISEGPAAISISKGGAQKTYSHVDPNEDASGFAIGAAGWLIAVADGHDGAQGAEIAIQSLLEHHAPGWTSRESAAALATQWVTLACEALSELNSAVLRDAAQRGCGVAPTTLSLALVRPEEDLIFHASIGDSHLFVHRERARDLGWQTLGRRRAYFLGYESQGPDAFVEKTVIGTETLSGASAVALATDGLSETSIGFVDPERAVNEIVAAVAKVEKPELRAGDLARGLAEAAIAEQRRNRAGDNIASAVLWLAD